MTITNRLILFAIFAGLGIVNTIASTGTNVQKNCNNRQLDTLFTENADWIRSFIGAYNIVNRECQIDSASIRKYIILAINEYVFQNRKGGEKRFNAAWAAMSTSVWGDDYEQLVVNVKQFCRRTKDMMGYYGQASTLVKNSRNWFQYAMDVYHTNDTTNSSDRSMVFDALMERFGKNGSTPEKIKVESLLYAELLNESPYRFKNIDRYLATISPQYQNSKERKYIITNIEKKYSAFRGNSGFIYIFEYLDSVKRYISALKDTTDYNPPIKIE